MVFSSPLFLFLFLPLVLLTYLLVGPRLRNTLLLVASLVFYAWGEVVLVLVMLGSILVNHALAVWIQARRGSASARIAVGIAVAANIGCLGIFKYAGWLWDSAAGLLGALGLTPALLGARPDIELPIGISFFTFQALSAVIDVYRSEGYVHRSPLNFALYVACFPQLIAGPIVRYQDVVDQLVQRSVTLDGFAYGVRRFALGLGKKVLIANVVAVQADAIFALPAGQLGLDVAWLGVVCYALQIYFDFSGYSDMAIGLGRMFGFHYLENFTHPYAARSVTEFWRRWHISLSTWFRDYLYIPLGGNRRGRGRTYFNLVLVFFLCGLWHGAAWTFVIWGLYHGLFLVLERVGLGRWLEKRPSALRHAYLLLAVLVGWVFFRAESLAGAFGYLRAMFAPRAVSTALHPALLFLDPATVLALLAGVIGCVPWLQRAATWRERMCAHADHPRLDAALETAVNAAVAALLVLSALELAAGSYNPFIYFRF
jgi:alginate O-acetyltransferase complex protein AlgI